MMRALAAYSGWGGAAEAFREPARGAWSEVSSELRELLSDEDYASARASTLTAFYTPGPVVDAIWRTLAAAGIGRGPEASRVLEPGCGTGNFMRAVPDGLALGFTGIELDGVSARIARALAPDAKIVNAPMEDCYVSPSSFDAVVGNVPYSDDITMPDPGTSERLPIHDWFARQAVAAVRPGGIVAVLTSRYTMDKRSPATRLALAREAELVGLARLPEETFRAQAGTDVVSDVLVLRRRQKPIDLDLDGAPDWVRTTQVSGEAGSAEVNLYVFTHPECVVGDMSIALGRFGATVSVRSGLSPEQIGEALASSLSRQAVGGLRDARESMAPALEAPLVVEKPADQHPYEFSLDEAGNVWFGNGESVEPVRLAPGDARGRAVGILRLRDEVRALHAAERDPKTGDAEVQELISGLKADYESFVDRFGRLCEPSNRRALGPDASADFSLTTCVWSLEVTERVGRRETFARTADTLERRTIRAVSPAPDHLDDPRDALAVSLDQRGRVDLSYIAGLLGTDEASALDALGDAVIIDPGDGSALTSDAYLSGDVGGKLRHVDALIAEVRGRAARTAEAAWLDAIGLSPERIGRADGEDAAIAALSECGAWQTALRPGSSHIAVDVPAWLDRLDDWRSPVRLAAPALIARAVQEAEDGLDLSGSALLAHLLRRGSLGNGRQAPESLANSPYRALFALARARGHLTDDALAALLVSSGSLSWYNGAQGVAAACLRALGREVPESIAKDGVAPLALELARALRERPELAEYLLWVQARQLGLADEEPVRIEERYTFRRVAAPVEDAADAAGLASFAARREAFASALSVEPTDPARLSELRALRARLADVQPEPVPAGPGADGITAKLGSSWIPAKVILDFLVEKLRAGSYDSGGRQSDANARRLEVTFDPNATPCWKVKATGADIPPNVQSRFGTPEYSWIAVVNSALNGSTISVTKPDPDGRLDARGNVLRVKDQEATMAAWQKRHVVESEFSEWVWSDGARSEKLCRIYNERFNSIAQRHYDGSYLTLPGSNPQIELRAHQKDAVARILQSDEGTLVAHVVGAGKTFTGVAACIEAKRLGRASKPMVVVPKNVTQQWASDFSALYPDARVLYMSDADMRGADSVRSFWARAAAGDWDAVVVAQPRFSALRLEPETRARYLDERIEEFTAALEGARTAEGKESFTVKALEGARTRMRTLASSLRSAKPIEGISFEDLGVDMVVVDEAHGFKNLATAGVSVAGMGGSASSQKCEDMLDKCQWLREQGKGGNIVFLTGTPVSNTMAELYNMQRYLAPGLLKLQGVENFALWANTFGEVTESVELKPEGNGFQVKTRFSRFHNLPELMSSFHQFADLRTKDQVKLDVPAVDARVVVVPPEPEQLDEMQSLSDRGDEIRAGHVDPAEDNMLKITGDGRKVALDPKLLYPDDPDVEPLEGGKIGRCAENVLAVWKETAAERGAQLVFCDASTPASGKWNVYDDLKRRLVDLGIPGAQVAFVSDAKNDLQRDQLFKRVREGEVRVLLGSTQKLGTGTNVQDRLAAIHDLDVPWRPSDLEQRLGRIERQGNSYSEVRDFRYVTKGTFDAYMYQVVQNKQGFIGQVFTSKSPARSMEDVDESVISYAELKAAATGDERMQRILTLENEVSQLVSFRASHARAAAEMKRRIERRYEPACSALARRSAMLAADEPTFRDAEASRAASAGSSESFVTVDGAHVPDKRAAVQALRRAALAVRPGASTVIGSYRGLWIVAESRLDGTDRSGANYVPYIGLAANPDGEVHMSAAARPFSAADSGPTSAIAQMDKIIQEDSKGPALVADKLDKARRELEEARAAANERWDGQDELDEKTAELERLRAEIEQGRGQDERRGPGGGDAPISPAAQGARAQSSCGTGGAHDPAPLQTAPRRRKS